MEQKTKKKGLTKYIVLILLVVLLVIAAIVGVKFLKNKKSAALVCDFLQSRTFSYSGTVEMPLEEDKANLLKQYMGLESAELQSFAISGSYRDDTLYANIKSAKSGTAITDLVLKSDEILLNVGNMYEVSKERMVNQQPFLAFLLPEWSWERYMDDAQLKGMFGVEIKTKPDVKKLVDQANGYLSDNTLAGAFFLADEHVVEDGWNKYIFHVTAGDKRLGVIRKLTNMSLVFPADMDATVRISVKDSDNILIRVMGNQVPGTEIGNFDISIGNEKGQVPETEKITDETYGAIKLLVDLMTGNF